MTNETVQNLEMLRIFKDLSTQYFEASASKGFHDDDDLNNLLASGRASKVYAELQDSKRLFLIAGEAVEAFEELRAGHAPTETYYTLSRAYADQHGEQLQSKGTPVTARVKAAMEQHDPEGTLGLFKPEGVPAELADVVIRIFDFCGTRGIDLAGAIIEKAQFNTTREQHHGKKF